MSLTAGKCKVSNSNSKAKVIEQEGQRCQEFRKVFLFWPRYHPSSFHLLVLIDKIITILDCEAHKSDGAPIPTTELTWERV